MLSDNSKDGCSTKTVGLLAGLGTIPATAAYSLVMEQLVEAADALDLLATNAATDCTGQQGGGNKPSTGDGGKGNAGHEDTRNRDRIFTGSIFGDSNSSSNSSTETGMFSGFGSWGFGSDDTSASAPANCAADGSGADGADGADGMGDDAGADAILPRTPLPRKRKEIQAAIASLIEDKATERY
jgi:hypothetical protein